MVTRLRSDAVAKRAAAVVAASLAVVVAFQIYWALGGVWGLTQALGRTVDESSAGLQLASAAVSLVLVAAILIVLGRVGLWRSRLPFALFRSGAWALTAVLLLVALNNAAAGTAWERFVFAPFTLALAVLCAFVSLAPVGNAIRVRDSVRGAEGRRHAA